MNDANDIVRELERWLARPDQTADAGSRAREIDLVRRAIAEINGLREKLGQRRGTRSIAAEDLNASNDE